MFDNFCHGIGHLPVYICSQVVIILLLQMFISSQDVSQRFNTYSCLNKLQTCKTHTQIIQTQDIYDTIQHLIQICTRMYNNKNYMQTDSLCCYVGRVHVSTQCAKGLMFHLHTALWGHN